MACLSKSYLAKEASPVLFHRLEVPDDKEQNKDETFLVLLYQLIEA
jgi:hypothetical protein